MTSTNAIATNEHAVVDPPAASTAAPNPRGRHRASRPDRRRHWLVDRFLTSLSTGGLLAYALAVVAGW